MGNTSKYLSALFCVFVLCLTGHAESGHTGQEPAQRQRPTAPVYNLQPTDADRALVQAVLAKGRQMGSSPTLGVWDPTICRATRPYARAMADQGHDNEHAGWNEWRANFLEANVLRGHAGAYSESVSESGEVFNSPRQPTLAQHAWECANKWWQSAAHRQGVFLTPHKRFCMVMEQTHTLINAATSGNEYICVADFVDPNQDPFVGTKLPEGQKPIATKPQPGPKPEPQGKPQPTVSESKPNPQDYTIDERKPEIFESPSWAYTHIAPSGKRTLRGMSHNQNFVDLFIDPNTGRVLGGTRNTTPVTQETIEDMKRYYVDNYNAFKSNPAKLHLVSTFLRAHGVKVPEEPTEVSRQKPGEKPTPSHVEPTTPQKKEVACYQNAQGYWPYNLKTRRLIGRFAIPSKQECETVVKYSQNGMVCAQTGMGYKLTRINGPTGMDWCGSSSSLNECLSANTKVVNGWYCSFGGSSWDLTYANGCQLGDFFPTLQACLERLPTPKPPKASAPKKQPPLDTLKPGESHRSDDKPAAKPTEDHAEQSHATPSTPKWQGAGNHSGAFCISCHDDKTTGKLPPFVYDLKNWEKDLTSSDAKTKQTAREWLDKVHHEVVETGAMPAKDRDAFLKSDGGKALVEFLRHYSGSKDAETEAHTTTAQPISLNTNQRMQILPAAKVEIYTRILPKVQSDSLAKVLNDPDTIWYDKDVMPAAYQDSGQRGLTGVSVPSHETPQRHPAAFADGNFLFPYARTGGLMDKGGPVNTYYFLNLPKHDGKTLPVRYFQQYYANDYGGMDYRWVFPEGTTTGEVIFENYRGVSHVMEIRTRTKTKNGWKADAFRPFPTAQSLEDAVKKLPDWEKSQSLKRLVQHLDNKNTLQWNPIQATLGGNWFLGARDPLPPIPEDVSAELLRSTPFRSAKGAVWKQNGNLYSYAPTTEQDFSIVPKHYAAHGIGVDSQSCTRCHINTNTPLRSFYPVNSAQYNDLQAYGDMWGSDQVFSFVPFDPEYYHDFLLDNNRHGVLDNRRMRADLIQKGILRAYRQNEFPEAFYHRSPGPENNLDQ